MRTCIDTRLFSLMACVCDFLGLKHELNAEVCVLVIFSEICFGVKTFFLHNGTKFWLEAFIWAIFKNLFVIFIFSSFWGKNYFHDKNEKS